jgi:Flp pilus assembly protein TadD
MKHLFLVICFTFLGGCASAPEQVTRSHLDEATIVAGPAEIEAYSPHVDLLALDEEMKAFLAEHVSSSATDQHKARQLLLSFFNGDGIEIQYDNIKTHTARETFHTQSGNCLSFTSLFIAMARELDLNVSYQEVEIPAHWYDADQLYIYNRHINVRVEFRRGKDQVVDFDMDSFEVDYPTRLISDQAALAQYHNNMSVYWLLEDDLARALGHSRAALLLEPKTSYMWSNLGVVYSHYGYYDYAEAAMLTALAHNASDPVAVSQLARLYDIQGKSELALKYRERAQRFRRKNPYYLYSEAEKHLAADELELAYRDIKQAIRLKRDDPEFHRLLGLVYLADGEFNAAERSWNNALHFATVTEDRLRISNKLQALSHHQGET